MDKTFQDIIVNGQGTSPLSNAMARGGFRTDVQRPYIADDGQKCVTVNTGRTEYDKEKDKYIPITKEVTLNELQNLGLDCPVANATSLRKDEWFELDRVVLKEARQRLKAWGDLTGANSVSLNGMSKSIYEWETQDDPGEAVVDMKGVTPGRGDSPRYQLEALPLPITHSDFFFDKRRIQTSRSIGMGIDLSMAEAAGRRVAETLEKTLIGVTTGFIYGSADGRYGVDNNAAPKVYGYTNYPNRVTKADMTIPSGANGSTNLTDWLTLREAMFAQNFYGPFVVYTAANYDQHLDNLFSTLEPSAGTLRKRLLEIDGISSIRRLDFLPGTTSGATHDVIFVQMTSDVVRAVLGMPITTIQWESVGGMQLHFKVMTIAAPNIRSDFDGRCGIGHGTSA